ncbi:MAG: hypothetical protein AAF546_04980 [Verrucomicrobiota bacterium]
MKKTRIVIWTVNARLLLLFSLGLFVGQVTFLHAQMPVCKLVLDVGEAEISDSRQAESGSWLQVKSGKWLWPGMYLRLSEGARGKLISEQGELKIPSEKHGNPMPIHAAEHRMTVNVESVFGGRPGGRTRGGEFSLYTPAPASRIRLDKLVVLRWEPTDPGGEVVVVVETGPKEKIWHKVFDGTLGRAAPSDLLDAMHTAAKAGKYRFNFISFEKGGDRKQIMRNKCEVLSKQEAEKLKERLALITNDDGPFYHVLRASLFFEYWLYGEAIGELEDAERRNAELAKSEDFQEFKKAVWKVCGKE